jgi:IS30 family transposase
MKQQKRKTNKQDGYRHITTVDRQQIDLYLKESKTLRRIAKLIGKGRNTVSYEVRENSVNGVYDWKKADAKAKLRRKQSKYQGMKVVDRPELRKFVIQKLKEDWSPEEISGRIKRVERHLPYVSAKGIYKFVSSVYGRQVEKFLRYKGKKKKGGSKQKVTQLTDRVFIDKRPKSIEKRRFFGDWEGDFIVSGRNGKGVLLVLVERKSRYVVIKRLLTQNSNEVNATIANILGGIVLFNSLTLDNDIVFRKHKALSKLLGRPVYFTHPYHSWEKGTVENMNKWIRQYVKKGSDISQYSENYIQFVEDRLNDRPRECLKFKTPREIFEKQVKLKKEISGIIKVVKQQKNRVAAVS